MGRVADPESELQVLGEVADLDVLEFGCGAAQWSIALQRWGAGSRAWTTHRASSSMHVS